MMEPQGRDASVEAVGADAQKMRRTILDGPSVDLGGVDELHESEVDAEQCNGDAESGEGKDGAEDAEDEAQDEVESGKAEEDDRDAGSAQASEDQGNNGDGSTEEREQENDEQDETPADYNENGIEVTKPMFRILSGGFFS
jgi:hypothetical protein